jgi:putative RNA 2'-phosphotransferase
MEASKVKEISKRLSYVLRHRPDSLGITLDSNGWITVDELLQAFAKAGKRLSLETLEMVVAGNDKQRFEFSDDRSQIRARQGHSLTIELGYRAVAPPAELFHGTATRFLESIFEIGLVKGRRHHVHLSTDRTTMLQVGQRHGKPVLLSVRAEEMHRDGFEFFVTGNNVWLTDHVPPKYIVLNQE